MGNNLNQVTMSGNCTRDGELRFTPSGQPVLSINLATNREWKDEDGEKHEKVVYTRWAVWGKRAEGLAQYILKGTALILTGRLEAPNAYEGKDGKPGASNQLTVEELCFQAGKRQGNGDAGGAPSDPPAAPVDDISDIPF